MTCEEFRAQLEQLVESRDGSHASACENHASTCENCRREWEDHLLLAAAVCKWKTRRAETASPRPSARLQRLQHPAWASAMIAAALLAACLPFVLTSSQESSPRVADTFPASQRPSPSITATAPSVPTAAAVRTKQADTLGRDYVLLAQDATASVTDMVVMLVPDEADALPPATGVARPEWIHRVEQSLEPISRNVEAAVEKVIDLLPLVPAPQTTEFPRFIASELRYA